MSCNQSAWKPIEYDDGYPVDEEFSTFDGVEFNIRGAARWLLQELPQAAENMCCWCEVVEGIEGQKSGKTILFATYGWSGAESIMSLIERRPDMKYFMMSWRRGGHYVFEIPQRFLDTAQAIEARRAATTGAVEDESAVAESHAPVKHGNHP